MDRKKLPTYYLTRKPFVRVLSCKSFMNNADREKVLPLTTSLKRDSTTNFLNEIAISNTAMPA